MTDTLVPAVLPATYDDVRPHTAPSRVSAVGTLTARRFALTAKTPREIVVPLMNPVMFALVIAPALAAIGPRVPGLDYMSFAAIGTAGLLIPLNCMFSGIGVIVDRDSGARRDLLAAPVQRALIVLANLIVAVVITAFQIVVLIGAAVLRGADVHTSIGGVGWFVVASLALAVAMYGVAEILANRIATLEEYVGALPAIAILPFFFAGSLFPISVLPRFVADFGRLLPLTHTLALMRYGLLGHNTTGLHDIWGMTNGSAMAFMSLAVVVTYAALFITLSVRVFTRAAVR